MKRKLSTKIICVMLSLALLISYAPHAATKAAAAGADITGRVADPATLNGWTNYFPTDTAGEISTENAGGIWTDKSVMTGAGDINALITGSSKVAMSDSENNFLVALSALGSNMTVTGMAAIPTDTVIILDMSNSIIDHVDSMATAANTSLKTLFEANPNNRVSIVSYNSTSSVLLPLGRYSAGHGGDYLTSSTQKISIARGVTNIDTQKAVSGEITNSAGTNTQAGVKAAIDQLKARTVTSGRLPVVILLTDGEPTIVNTDIANLNGTHMSLDDYLSGSYKPGYAFLTQLTMAYMKQVVYPEMLFYTIGVGNGVTDDLMQDVINPDANISDRTLRNYWNTFNSLGTNGTMTVGQRSWVLTKTAAMQGLNTDYLSKIQNSQGQLVNGYFPATSRDLAKDIEKAFESVMAEIISKSAYVPTLVQGAEEFSGYISFVDKIGKYMEVDSIKGVVFDDTLHTGEILASHFAGNSSGGSLKPYSQMSALGKQFIDSVATRLNVNTDTAYTIIQNAWNKGWISYTSSSSYSNWFGWLSNASGGYIGIWDGTYPVTDPNAVFINRSYAMLGTLVNDNDTTDMMYSTIRVRERISTGEQEVNFAIPASLIPTVTYDVSLKDDKSLDSISVNSATPIRLVYEVKLDASINSLTMLDVVDAEYLAANTDSNGNVSFYSNQYETDNTVGYGKLNTYSYFRPSRQNDRYYYQNDSAVYVNTSGKIYETDSTDPVDPIDVSGTTFYYQHQVYSTSEGVKIGYHPLPADILRTAKHNGDGTYTVTAGTVRADYAGIGIAKASNNTGTLPYSHVPFEDTNGAHFDDMTHRMVVGVTLANNGRITVAPASGIKLTKSMTADASATGNETFTFHLTAPGVEGVFEAYKLSANGGAESTVTFTAGSAAVSLKADETLYIGGLPAGTTVTVTEEETLAHTAHQVLVNGSAVNGKTASVTVSSGKMQAIEFINGNRSTGSFAVSKVITHELGEAYTIPNNENTRFSIRLELRDFEGNLISGSYTGKFSSKEATETVTFANGIYTATLSHLEQLQINGLPEGSTVKATEELTEAQKALFNTAKDVVYYENRQAVSTDYAEVSIAANNTSSVIVENSYTPAKVYPVNIRVQGSKNLTSPDSSISSFTGSFTFELQKLVWNGTAYVYEKISTADGAVSVSYNGELGVKQFVFSDAAFANEVYDRAGRYAYRVVEIPSESYLEQGVSFDPTVHGFDVEVTDENMDGKLEIKEIHPARPQTTGEHHETIEGQMWHIVTTSFTNQVEQDATDADIEIQKLLLDSDGKPIADASGFQFEVAEITALADGDVLTQEQMDALFENAVTSSETAYSGIARVSRTLNAEGTYLFAVRELKSKNGNFYPTGYSFDTSVKFVKVTVADNAIGNVLVATAIPAGSAALSGGNYTVSLADGEANAARPYMATVSFQNTYTPKSTFLNVNVSKQLIGRSWLTGDANSFTFTLTPANDGTHAPSVLYNAQGNAVNQITGTVDVVNTEDSSINEVIFGTLLFRKAGIYYYDIRETTPNANGITPDPTVYGIVVTVTDVNGQLTADYVVINQENNDEILFVNRYTAGPAKYAISGTKNFAGGIYYGDDFAFIMTNTANEAEVYTASNNTDGIFTFPEITYHTTGTYQYRIEEIIPEDSQKLPGVSYNPEGTVYTVTVTVTDGSMGSLVVSSVSHEQEDIVFTNVYVPKSTEAVIQGNKVLVGERALQDGEFEFAIYTASESWDKADETPFDTTANTVDGKFAFAPITYSGIGSVGIHRYLVEEVSGSKGGVSYDTTVYRVAVVVSNDYATGSLKSQVYIFSQADAALDTIAFTNTYVTSGNIIIGGTKILYGRNLQEGEFAFDIYLAADGDSQPVGDPFQTVYNKADGSFSFNMGNYTSSGSYFFIIQEQNTGMENVAYDTGSYLVQVDLKDDQNGNLVYDLKRDVHITRIDGENRTAADSVTFENEFMISTSVTVDITKEMVNKGASRLSPEGFQFLLEKVDSDEKYTATSNQDGLAQLVLNFTGRDAGYTYSYKLTEVNTGVANVTYSEAEYSFTVSLSIDDDGKLVATVVQNEVAVDQVSAVFTNEYDYTPPDGPPTGDDTSLHLLFTAFLVSAMGLAMIALNNEKKNRLI